MKPDMAMKKSVQRGDILTGDPCPGTFVSSRKMLRKGDFVIGDGSAVTLVKTAPQTGLAEAAQRMDLLQKHLEQAVAVIRKRG